MLVVKRDGRQEPVAFDKITARIKKLCYGFDPAHVDPVVVSQKVVLGVYNGVSTFQLDDLASETAAFLTTQHPDYGKLAARIAVSNLHKQTCKSFSETMLKLHAYVNPKTGEHAPLISDEIRDIITEHAERLNGAIVYDRDFEYDYFGFKTLEKSYLQKMNGKIAERPQQMLMRVALGIHKRDIDAVIESYHLMSEKWFTHATPTMFNAGTTRPQMSSCFLLSMQGDSIEGIYGTLKRCAQISKSSGGVGLSVSNIRASGSYIAGTNGTSNGLVPMLRVFNNTARFVNQGGGKRQGSFAVYIEPWHADIFDFLDLRKNHGKEEARARDLFYALWVPDLFMKRVEANGEWSLFCPHECPGLYDSWGAEFEALYEKYEAEGKARKTIKAQELWFAVLDSQIETGTPCATRLRHGCPAPSPRPAAAAPRAVAPGARAILRPLPSPPRLVAGTSSTRTRRTRSRTSRTSARSAARTCAPRSSSTRRPTRSPSATSRRSRCRASPSTAPSTTRSCTTSRTSSPRTSTA